ncbi:MAG: nitroreductase family protein [Candidatus Thermoplasmatota archaeon]|nr:nitroreductase family protein [Candidatus Thermoplasmatota archaeon]MBS3790380.1 nitroreductase family protein [Candidatus Thermoplasmatota archaeon]
MDVFEAVKERGSIRKYKGEPIEQEDMEKMVEAARLAPSAKNLQPWKLVVVQDPEVLKELVPICQGQRFVEGAGAFVIGMIDGSKWSEVDLSIAMDHLSLEAVELGYGTCWIGAFDKEGLERKFGLSDGYEPLVCMTVGVPAEKPRPPTKKSVEELVEWVRVE